MDELTSTTYRNEVKSLAESIVEDCDEKTREAVEQFLWDSIDSHQWVIYTYYNLQVLQYTDNAEYTPDNFGTEGLFDNGIDAMHAKLAFGALYADVQEAIDWESVDAAETSKAEEVGAA